MLKKFYPNDYVDSTYNINFLEYWNSGYRAVIFDIDNTLVPHGKPIEDRALRLMGALREQGFKICLMSNNKEARVAPFAKALAAPYISKANKPFKAGYLKALGIVGMDKSKCIFVGDQLFTDVYGAKNIGIYSILVKPIHPSEEIQIVLKRYLEKIVLYFYEKDIVRKEI